MTDAELAKARPDFNQTGFRMGQLRTTNNRRNRVARALKARTAAAAAPAPVASKPARTKPAKAAS